MMAEIYVSWCEGLPENKEAMKILRDSGIVDGIETSEYEDIDRIHSEGLKANIHRPFRWQDFNLEDNSLPEYSEDEIKEYNKSDSPVLGFHLIDYEKHNEKSDKGIVENMKRNIEKLDSLFERRIVFELPPYDSYLIDTRKNSAKYFTSKEVVRELVENTSAGVLLDISHVFVGGMNKIKEGLFDGTIEDYFSEIMDVSKDKVWQLHVNVPRENEKGYEDVHKTFENDELSERMIQIIKSVLEKSPNISVITLELDTGLPPVEHARKTVEQAEILNKRLNIKNKIEASPEH